MDPLTKRHAPGDGPAGRTLFDDEGSINGKRLKLAIIGCGHGGRMNLAAIRDLVELITPAAVVDPNPENADRLCNLYDVTTKYEKLDEVLQDKSIDAVAVCTPPGKHAINAERAARAGKHVLVDKPMALSAAECDRMIEAAESSGVTLMVAEERRFTDSVFTAREIVRGGQIGELIHVCGHGSVQLTERRVAWWNDPELAGPDAMLNVFAIDAIDQILWICDAVPERISAEGLRREGLLAGADDVGALIRMDSGTIVQFHFCAARAETRPMKVDVYGASGTLSITNGQHLIHNGEPARVIESGVSSWNLVYREFASAIRAHRKPLSSGAQGKLVVATIEAISRSLAQRRPVELSEILG